MHGPQPGVVRVAPASSKICIVSSAIARSSSLREAGELEGGSQDFTRYQVGFTLGGPIKRDKTHYFLSYEYVDEGNITLFRPQGAFVDLAEDREETPVSDQVPLSDLDRRAHGGEGEAASRAAVQGNT